MNHDHFSICERAACKCCKGLPLSACESSTIDVMQGTLQELSKKLGVEVRIAGYARLQCGEGMETQHTDFASEVAAMAA